MEQNEVLTRKSGKDFQEWFAEHYGRPLGISVSDLPIDTYEPLDQSRLEIVRDYLRTTRGENSGYIVDSFLFDWITSDRTLTQRELTELLNVFDNQGELGSAIKLCLIEKRLNSDQIRTIAFGKLNGETIREYHLDLDLAMEEE